MAAATSSFPPLLFTSPRAVKVEWKAKTPFLAAEHTVDFSENLEYYHGDGGEEEGLLKGYSPSR